MSYTDITDHPQNSQEGICPTTYFGFDMATGKESAGLKVWVDEQSAKCRQFRGSGQKKMWTEEFHHIFVRSLTFVRQDRLVIQGFFLSLERNYKNYNVVWWVVLYDVVKHGCCNFHVGSSRRLAVFPPPKSLKWLNQREPAIALPRRLRKAGFIMECSFNKIIDWSRLQGDLALPS